MISIILVGISTYEILFMVATGNRELDWIHIQIRFRDQKLLKLL